MAGNHGYPSVEKVDVDGNYAVKVEVWFCLPPMVQVVGMVTSVPAWLGITVNGIILPRFMVPEGEPSKKSMWMVNYSSNRIEQVL